MSNRTRRFMAACAAALMLAGTVIPTSVLADSQASAANANGSVPLDVIVLRPVGFVTLGLGTGLFIGSLPILLVTRPQDIAKPADNLIGKPARYLWKDELGGH